MGKSPTKNLTTQTTHFYAAVLAYTKLEVLKLKCDIGHLAAKYPVTTPAQARKFCSDSLSNKCFKIRSSVSSDGMPLRNSRPSSVRRKTRRARP